MQTSEIRQKLRDFICQELLNNPTFPLTDDEPLITGGLMDSFSLAQVGVFVEQAFGIYLPDTDLTVENMNTLGQMINNIVAKG